MVDNFQKITLKWKVLFLIAAVSSVTSCSVGCSNTISEVFENPSGDKVIYKVKQNCSATTPFIYKYYISKKPNDVPGINAKELQIKGKPFFKHVRGDVEVVWTSDTSVKVTRVYLSNAYKPIEVTLMKQKSNSTIISYQGF